MNTSLRVKGEHKSACRDHVHVIDVLSAGAEIVRDGAECTCWFGRTLHGPQQLVDVLRAYAELPNEAIARLHPAHDQATLRSASDRFHWFEQGACVVHHMFGQDVVNRVRRDYADAFVTAHLEVPGEMFALGFEAQKQGRGVVGSTSNILDFILAAVKRASAPGQPTNLRFVLGTESGMSTSVARAVRTTSRDRARGGPTILVDRVSVRVRIDRVSLRRAADMPVRRAGEAALRGGCASCPHEMTPQLAPGLARSPGSGRRGAYAPIASQPKLAVLGAKRSPRFLRSTHASCHPSWLRRCSVVAARPSLELGAAASDHGRVVRPEEDDLDDVVQPDEALRLEAFKGERHLDLAAFSKLHGRAFLLSSAPARSAYIRRRARPERC